MNKAEHLPFGAAWNQEAFMGAVAQAVCTGGQCDEVCCCFDGVDEADHLDRDNTGCVGVDVEIRADRIGCVDFNRAWEIEWIEFARWRVC